MMNKAAASSTAMKYVMSPTGAKFHASQKRVKAIMGPVGSGKTVMCCWEVWMRANQMPIAPDGYRKCRWAFIRNTFWELENTTLKTWMDWFGNKLIPEPFGKYTGKPKYEHVINIPPEWEVDGEERKLIKPGIHLHVLFIALDRPEDADKLGSLEISGAYINEAREVPYEVVSGLSRRIGRFPSVKDGGCPYPGIIMDTNPPPDNHWWFTKDREDRPEDWDMWTQPSGLSKEAENIENLPGGINYYLGMMSDLTADEINVYVHGQYGYIRRGEPVFKNYDDDLHAAKEPIKVNKERDLIVGLDYGLTPCAAIIQDTPEGGWVILRELVTFNTSSDEFAPMLKKFLLDEFPDFDIRKNIRFYGDPSVKRSEVDKKIVTDSFLLEGMIVQSSPCNNVWETRKKCVNQPLSRLILGKPGLKIDPACTKIRQAFNGGYHYKKIPKSGGGQRIMEIPDKNEFSHIMDALQYALAGGGEVLMQRKELVGNLGNKPFTATMNWNPHNALGRR